MNRHRIAQVLLPHYSWLAAALATAAVVWLHVVFLRHAGGLWRDEASTVWTATLPSFHDLWRALPYDHCPPLVHLLIRAWCAMGFGKTDPGLRVLGLLIGLLLPAAFWVASRSLRQGIPLLPLALVALNASVVRFGDTFRGYGIGSALNVLALAMVWRAASEPARGRILMAALVATLSVQALYQNALFVLAACCGGVAASLLRRRWRAVWPTLGVGLIAAVSLLPYVSIVRRSQDWYALEKSGFTLSHGWQVVSTAMASPLPFLNWAWVILIVLGVGIGLFAAITRAEKFSGDARRERVVFAATTLVVGTAGFIAFLEKADLPTQPWYYLPWLAFAGACLDGILSDLIAPARSALALAAVVAAAAAFGVPRTELQQRQTNMDIVAAHLNQNVTPADIIIVHPWYKGVSFARYYHGAAPWTTIPQLEDHCLHRYDLMKEGMRTKDPVGPVWERAAATLQSGNHVWLVGEIRLDGAVPEAIRPAPDNPWGWYDAPYSTVWGAQMGQFVVAHAAAGRIVEEVFAGKVFSEENVPLVRVEGWRH